MRRQLETGTDCYILTQSSSEHSSTSFLSWLGLLNRGSLKAQSPLSATDSHAGIMSPNWLQLQLIQTVCAPGYITVLRLPASAVLPLIYTGASLDWRLGRGSICYISPLSRVESYFHYHSSLLSVFHISVCWWFLTRFWVWTNFFKSLGLSTVF